jgi:protein SCO1/2
MKRRELFTGAGDTACTPAARSCGGQELIPNVTLRTHENRQVKFYDDLVKGKQVVVNMMYANCEGQCPAITARLIEVHRALAPRMGRDLFFCSVSLKPQQDDPAALAAFAEMHGALLPGWQFLTGDAFDIDTLRFALFRHDHIKFDLDLDSHAGQLRIINDATHRWLMVTPFASKATVLQHISWADPPRTPEQRARDNRELQERIQREVSLYGYRKVI